MKCSTVKPMISRYVDQDLDPDEKKAFELHLRECPGCEEALAGQMAVHHLFSSTERFEAPYGLATRVMARIEENEKRTPFWGFFTLQPTFLRAVEIAFALMVVFIGMVSGNLLVAGRTPERPLTVQESFSLDLFQATPPDSIGGVYVKLTGASDER
ncbi:MAG: zf-HC2 domain-containing protein [Deltaproteobacteria bacterium]|nr:zf-HC2 domain-containing protein [Deltaproteobacteria bacterium]